MAAPITHIALTEKVFDKHFANKDKQSFLIGTSLPDIRYLGVIAREKTHLGGLRINDLERKNSFEAGFLFHSLVDQVTEKFRKANSLYTLYPNMEYFGESLKLVEDELLYDEVSNWKEIAGYFKTIVSQERLLGVTEKDLVRWHKLLGKYFLQKPSDKSRETLCLGMGFAQKMVGKLNTNIAKMSTNEEIQQIIAELYRCFDNLL